MKIKPKAERKTLTLTEKRRKAGLAAKAANLARDPDYYRKLGRKGRCAPSKDCPLPQTPTTGYTGSRCSEIVTPQGREPSCYEIRPVAKLITSHDPDTWEPNPAYPQHVQERDYKGDPNEQLKVLTMAKALDPLIVLSNSPTPTDGPPVITTSGVVLGGNGRTMAIRVAYRDGLGDPYRAMLLDRAPMFGLKRDDIEEVTHPILVRAVPSLDNITGPAMAAASSHLNESLTAEMDEKARAVSLSRRVSPATFRAIADLLEIHETLRQAMESEPGVFIARMQEDDIFTPQNNAAMTTAGQLTEEGKATVEGAFLGRVVGTPERIRLAPPSALRRLDRLTPYLVRVEARANGQDLIPVFQGGLDLLISAGASGVTPRQYANQQDFTRKRLFTEDEIRAAETLEAGLGQVGKAGAAWARVADYDPKQMLLIGTHPSLTDAKTLLFDGAMVGTIKDFARRIRESAATIVASEKYQAAGLKIALLADVAEGLPWGSADFMAQITQAHADGLIVLGTIPMDKMSSLSRARANVFSQGKHNALNPTDPIRSEQKRSQRAKKAKKKKPKPRKNTPADSVPADLTTEEFVSAVRTAASHPDTARFGRDKAFIGSTWHHMTGVMPMTLEDFKVRLLAAHQAGAITISRADMVEVMDPAEVKESEIGYLQSTFHFIDDPG